VTDLTVYIAHPDYLGALCQELGDVSSVAGNLVFSTQEKRDICFASDIWFRAQIVKFESISEAVRILRAAGKYWFLNPVESIRRSHLIAEQLRKLPNLKQSFPISTPLPQIGCFSLLDKNTLVYAQERWKDPPLGDFQFIEDKENPPNRAYLKLWEALALYGCYPAQGETAIDLGASPGGWTYVMQSLGVNVTAVDKAPLEPRIAQLPNVTFLKQSAFALNPANLKTAVDWLLCDVACYPERSYHLIMAWLNSGKAKRMIVTIKLQGATNLEVIGRFKAIPGARVIHLLQNKHEVTLLL